MATDDPFTWSSDQVRSQICSQASDLRSVLRIKPILNLQNLEQALSENDIDGENLLALDDVNVKEDLGISSFGQRREIRKIILHLRDISPLYQATLNKSHKRRLSTSEKEPDTTPESKKRRVQSQNPSLSSNPTITNQSKEPHIPSPPPTELAAPETAPSKRRIQPQNLSTEPLTQSREFANSTRFSGPVVQSSSAAMAPEDFDPANLSDVWQEFLERYREQSDESDYRPYNETDSEKELNSEDDASLVAELESEEAMVTPRLSLEDIQGAINETLEEYKRSWRLHKQVKKHKVAYRRWTQAAKAGTRRPQQNALQRELDALQDRLAKFRRSIEDVSMDYHKTTEVKRNCLNLEATVEDIAEREYYLEVLASEEPPAKPEQSLQPPAPQEKLSDGEELLESSDSIGEQDDDSSDSISEISLVSDGERSLALSYGLSDTDWSPKLPVPMPTDLGHLFRDPRPIVNETIDADHEIEVTDLTDADAPEEISEPPLPSILSTSHEIIPTTPRKIGVPLLVPSYPDDTVRIEEIADDEDEDSDLDRLPKNRYRNEGNTRETAISLGSSPARVSDDQAYITDVSVKTPPLNPTPAANIKRENPRNIAYPDIKTLRDTKWTEVKGNAELALCKMVYRTDRDAAQQVLQFLAPINAYEVPDRLRAGLCRIQDIDEDDHPVSDTIDPHDLWTFFFLVYVHKRGYKDVWVVSEAHLDKAFTMIDDKAFLFDKALRPLLRWYTQSETFTANQIPLAELVTNNRSETLLPESGRKSKQNFVLKRRDTTPPRQIYTDSETDLDDEPSSLKKRKRRVEQSQQALSQQRDDQYRVQEQERRRQMMMDKLHSQEAAGQEHNGIINSVEDVPILLHQHIARRIKPHQESGVQFIWRELVEDQKHQGCLLAHTMGLGKTMQVISFLVTLAQCNSSDRAEVRALIPEKLRSGRILILCPASLVDNWYDEILMWTPPNSGTRTKRSLLGNIYRISGSRNQKIMIVKEWQKSSPAVLIIGYESLRSLLTGKSVSDEDKKYLENALLQEPCVVIGDEAHKMKNAKSAISKVAQSFKTNSRIALTGSPLNNHLEEYHTMIDWIAPGYLGTIVQFRSKYSEPIEQGLFAESTRYEKRKSLERLYVLKRDLAPKIDRRDISAIAKDMPQKTEFFITVPLTDLQRDMYGLLIRHILSGINTNGSTKKSSNAQLWSWLSILSWLCNHPTILTQKLQRQDKSSVQAGVDNEDFDEDGAPANVDLDKYPIASLLPKFLEYYARYEEAEDRNNPELSTRALVTRLLIEESVSRGERLLLFSHSIPTLDFLQNMLDDLQIKYMRIDGSTRTDQRQAATKEFNDDNNDYMVFLISTRAGGLGLNLQGANRVIIYDFGFNPSWEEQAIGRAYRLGQKKPVFVYRFRAGGSFEDNMYNKSIFKTQLFSRVVDQKNVIRHTSRDIKDYLFEPVDPEQKDLRECLGKDELLDSVVAQAAGAIRDLILTETFQREDEDDELTAEEKKMADAEVEMERLQRTNPAAYAAKVAEKHRAAVARAMQQPPPQASYPVATQLHANDVHGWFKNATQTLTDVVMRDAAKANEEKMGMLPQVQTAMDTDASVVETSAEQPKAPGCDPQ